MQAHYKHRRNKRTSTEKRQTESLEECLGLLLSATVTGVLWHLEFYWTIALLTEARIYQYR